MTLIPGKRKSKRNKDDSLASMVCSHKKKRKEKKLKIKKKRDREKSFTKWHNKIKDDENTICLGKFKWEGSPRMNVNFNTEMEHFLLEVINKDNTTIMLSNTYTVSLIRALSKALHRAEQKDLIVHEVALAPPTKETEEEESCLKLK
jgi:hypothetical protein